MARDSTEPDFANLRRGKLTQAVPAPAACSSLFAGKQTRAHVSCCPGGGCPQFGATLAEASPCADSIYSAGCCALHLLHGALAPPVGM